MTAYARKRAKRLKVAIIPRRERNGRSQRQAHRQRETEAAILETALQQPHRRLADNPRCELLGSALGRLRRSELLTQTQLEVGEAFAVAAGRFMRDILANSPRVKGIDLLGSGGASCGAGPTEDAIERTRRAWDEIEGALAGTLEPRECKAALVAVCVCDRDPGQDGLGRLRVALNALHRLWR